MQDIMMMKYLAVKVKIMIFCFLQGNAKYSVFVTLEDVEVVNTFIAASGAMAK